MSSLLIYRLVLDCFCGSGTTVVAAQELNRKWIGIDQSEHAIKVIKKRLACIPASLFSKVEFEILEQVENKIELKKIQTQNNFFESKQKIKLAVQSGQA